MSIILASQSPRRLELLAAAGLSFEVMAPEGEDVPPPRARRYAALAQRLALQKASSVAARVPHVVLGADTIVVCEGTVLGKPATKTEARRMLAQLSGRRHLVYTGVALVQGPRRLLGYERTEVWFRALRPADISRYLATGEPMDKAGAYAIQGAGAALIATIRGSYTNVIGLPVPKVLAMLEEFARGRESRIENRE